MILCCILVFFQEEPLCLNTTRSAEDHTMPTMSSSFICSYPECFVIIVLAEK